MATTSPIVHVPVSWSIGISGGRCDFCSAEIKGWSQVACLHGLVVTVDDPTVQMTMPGDWDVCTIL